jgi:phosphosulfolactate phosphohydrolase-like enzyme
VCAGTDGHATSEDVLCAGGIAYGVETIADRDFEPDDSRRIAMQFFQAFSARPSAMDEAIGDSRGGRNLRELGYYADIERAALCNLYSIVPEFDAESQRIVRLHGGLGTAFHAGGRRA